MQSVNLPSNSAPEKVKSGSPKTKSVFDSDDSKSAEDAGGFQQIFAQLASTSTVVTKGIEKAEAGIDEGANVQNNLDDSAKTDEKSFLNEFAAFLQGIGLLPEGKLPEDPMQWLAMAEENLSGMQGKLELPVDFIQQMQSFLQKGAELGLIPENVNESSITNSFSEFDSLVPKNLGIADDSADTKELVKTLKSLGISLAELQHALSLKSSEGKALANVNIEASVKNAEVQTQLLAGMQTGIEAVAEDSKSTGAGDEKQQVTNLSAALNASENPLKTSEKSVKGKILDPSSLDALKMGEAEKIISEIRSSQQQGDGKHLGDRDSNREELLGKQLHNAGQNVANAENVVNTAENSADKLGDFLGSTVHKVNSSQGSLVADSLLNDSYVPRRSAEMHEMRILRQVNHQLQIALKNGHTRTTLQLSPEHLGKVDVHLDMKEGNVRLHMRVENDSVRQILESQTAQLKESLQSQNLNLEGLDVQVKKDPAHGESGFSEQNAHRGSKSSETVKLTLDELTDVRSDTGRRLGYNQFEFVG